MSSELIGEPIHRKRGNTARDKITVLDEESTAAPKAPLDVTGFGFVLTCNTHRDPDPGASPAVGTELFQITGLLVDPSNGVVEFEPTAPNADQVAGTYWYDVEMTPASGLTKTIAKNRYTFDDPITQP